ncbi:hypothetical protein Bhyg_03700, partial [Pseudolycoriella hygida]
MVPNIMNEDNNKDTAATDGCNVIGAEDDVVVIASTSNGPAKKRKRYSTVWNHFDTSNDDTDEWANCKYCGNNMIRHLKHTQPDVETRTVSEEIEIIEFSQERYREALIKYIVVCNQPFTEVEQQAFLDMIHILNPAAITISSSTVKRDIMKKFEEK